MNYLKSYFVEVINNVTYIKDYSSETTADVFFSDITQRLLDGIDIKEAGYDERNI